MRSDDAIVCDVPRRVIASAADVAEGMRALAARDPAWTPLIERTGVPPLRRWPGGFEGLASIVVSQQVSVASARAIWERTRAVLGEVSVARLLSASDDDLRRCGLSRPKQRALRAAASAAAGGRLDFDALERAEADAVHDMLTAIAGIGPWTADIYILMCLGHRDGFAAGDLAVQEAARHAFGLPARPGARELLARAEAWRPWRGVAAHLLWAYYAVLKGREGIVS
ncbi:MAG: DNA-3-methyladenine glycosylase family protein [Pseudochelatococcus sp.]|jgi:DNA-3-methyladenine glycosylase II|uniref:DNA-3-methyladenine glycosylase family protein n=1 Tax=Pseudochelatococcus sp. TaxID=2020869 RepID=UPI003D9133A9